MSTLTLLAFTWVAGANPADEEFFETNVRPVLAVHCYSCHGPRKQRGGIRLDGPEYLMREVDGGEPVIRPKDIRGSRLLKAVRHEGDNPMPPPPKGKLKTAQIAALERWVGMGAPWPARAASKENAAKSHWAYQLVVARKPPEGADASPIDRFVAARLRSAGLTFAAPADKTVWLRRVTFDLIGLPPTEGELGAFLADNSVDAAARVVDRLLASPRYGERWGRHWLDVARYADTREAGFQVDTRYPFAWTYRDWVIRAFNTDLPFDQFVVQQIAADRVVDRPDHPDLAALGFLNVGRRFSSGQQPNVHDLIDDRLDAIGRGLLGLSIGCARCHDHKFDPIPTRDYYSLYGVFAGVAMTDRPIAASAAERAAIEAFAAEIVRRQQAWEDYSIEQHSRLFGDAFSAKGYAASLMEWKKSLTKRIAPPPGLNVKLSNRRRTILKNLAAADWNPILGPWFAFAKLPPDKFANQAPTILLELAEPGIRVNARVADLFRDRPVPQSLDEVAARYGELFAAIDRQWRSRLDRPRKVGKLFAGLGEPAADQVLKFLLGKDGFGYFPVEKMQSVLNGKNRQAYIKLKDRVGDLKVAPNAPPHAMAVTAPERLDTPRVFVRGNPDNRGAEVPRQFLAVATVGERKPFANGTGRLELARAIVDPRNPLTARVWVNRVWGHLFGVGLVRTPSDFGTRGERPTHPELLDWLAAEFVKDGWSTKRLVRHIVLSHTYAQSSADRPEAFAKDPQNALLGRMNRRRLDLEVYRDATLQVAGVLDSTVGSQPVDLSANPTSHRRTVYAKVDRVGLSALHRAFDFANPDLHTPRRFVTTVPQQAVLLLNHPFAADAARSFAARMDKETGTGAPAAWAARAYRLALGREPTESEVSRAIRFLSTTRVPRLPENRSVYWTYGLARWDREKKTLSGFEPLKEFQGDAWQDAARAGKAQLTAGGGRTAAAPNLVLVRRWVAPAAGKVRIDGKFLPKDAKAAASAIAVRGENNVFGAWSGKREATRTEVAEAAVAAGQSIDFFVEPEADPGSVEYDWRFTVEAVDSPAMGRMVWNSAGHFDGPAPPPAAPLTVKQQFAQVLLLTNEFATLD